MQLKHPTVTRTCRITGITMRVRRGTDAPWIAECTQHEAHKECKTKREALAWIAFPCWCDDCAIIIVDRLNRLNVQ